MRGFCGRATPVSFLIGVAPATCGAALVRKLEMNVHCPPPQII